MTLQDRLHRFLPADVLLRIRERAAQFDAENRFFAEDLRELAGSGYLKAGVPEQLGGGGLSLGELIAAQRLLAVHAPATALGVNMHLVWGAVAALLRSRGDERLNWVLEDIAAGEIFGFGISEPGNDAVLMNADTVAVPDGDRGFRVSGTKVFTTLSPVWTRLGVHAVIADEHGEPVEPRKLVYGFISRDGEGRVRKQSEGSQGLVSGAISHPDTWNPLGMRATQSWNTVLTNVPLGEKRVAAVTDPFNPQEPLVFAIFAAFSTLTAAVYAGISDRALELLRERVQREHHFADGSVAPLVSDPEVATRVTDAMLAHRGSLDALEVLSRELDECREAPDIFVRLSAARNRVTDEARGAVEVAMRYCGTKGYQADSELARLYRDVLAGLFHPTSSRSLAQMVRGTL